MRPCVAPAGCLSSSIPRFSNRAATAPSNRPGGGDEWPMGGSTGTIAKVGIASPGYARRRSPPSESQGSRGRIHHHHRRVSCPVAGPRVTTRRRTNPRPRSRGRGTPTGRVPRLLSSLFSPRPPPPRCGGQAEPCLKKADYRQDGALPTKNQLLSPRPWPGAFANLPARVKLGESDPFRPLHPHLPRPVKLHEIRAGKAIS